MPPSGYRLVDTATVDLRAGDGGRGAATFRREPYTPRGGPDGGDGGDGGSIILRATPNQSSLQDVARRRVWRAGDGGHGARGRRDGRRGEDLRLEVPVGTMLFDDRTGDLLGDLDAPGAELVAARGGAGGRGNVHFKSSVNQAPQTAEPGLPGESFRARFELKLIAQVGLVGAPNAGKSSLLRAISAATPEIGDYPFTTLEPQLGVADLSDGSRVVVADIPGLIEGAAMGAGLGQRFLRHIERTRLLVYVVDGAGPDPAGDLMVVRREVEAYSEALARRPSLLCVNKLDLPAARDRRDAGAFTEALWISAREGTGVDALLERVRLELARLPEPEKPVPAGRRVRLRRTEAAPQVVRHGWGYEITGSRIERLVERTDFDAEPAVQRFQVILDRMGVSAALEEAGAEPGDTVRVGDLEFEYQP